MANLNENFKIKNGLTVNTTISAGGNIATDGAILSGDINIDQLFGSGGGGGTITEVVAGTGLTGGGTTGSVTLDLSAGDGVQATANCVSVDSTVVRTTGTQFIAGTKNFSGTICANGGTTTVDALKLTSYDEGSDAAPIQTFFRGTCSSADGDYLGQVKFRGQNDFANEVNYSKITGKISDASNGTEDGLMEFAVQKAGSMAIVARQTHDALKLINDTGLQVDGQILSAGSELHSLFSGGGVDSGTACKLAKYNSAGTNVEDSILTETSSRITVTGNLSATGTICGSGAINGSTVTSSGDTFVGNTLTVNGDSQMDGALTVDDFACFKDSFRLDGNSTTSGTATVTTLSAAKICSNDAYFNSAIGCLALDSTTTGCKNVAVGLCSSRNQTIGSNNVALGDCSGHGNTTGSHNVTIGSQAGFYSLSGDHNMAMGQFALYDNWGGDYNTAIGSASMQCNTTGSNNAALGYRAMMNNTTGNDNFAVGECALQSNVNGIGNTALGHNALGSSVTGNYTVAIGDNAGTYFANGCNTLSAASDSIYIGRNTKGKDNNDNNSIVIGYNACSCGQNTVKIGNNCVTAACVQVAWTAVSDERDKTDITDLNHGLEFIGDLKPKAFKYRRTRTSSANDGICRYGFLAQDIQETEDGDKVIVSESNPEQLGLNSDYLVPILVKAVQELEARVIELEG